MNSFIVPIPSQLPIPDVGELRSVGELGQLVIIALVVLVLAIAIVVLVYTILQQARSKSKDDDSENKRLNTVIENMHNLTNALIGDREHTLKIIEASSETQRLITVAINENTGSNRTMNTTMETMSRDLREYTTLHSDSVEQLVGAIERSESQMVAFGNALKGAVDDIHNNAKDHEEIVELVQKVIDEILIIKLDMRMAFQQLIPTMNPPKTVESTVTLPQQIEVTVKQSEPAPTDASKDDGGALPGSGVAA
jgi:hypothetical protein